MKPDSSFPPGQEPYNLLYVGIPDRDFIYDPPPYSPDPEKVPLVGAVEVYRIYGNPTPRIPVFTLYPPPDPGGTEPKPVNCLSFGQVIVLADIDGDGANELLVGANNSDGANGRIYIFWGDPTKPYGIDTDTSLSGTSPCTIIKPPPKPPGTATLFGPESDPRGEFGYRVAAADLNLDYKTDLIVGEPKFPGGHSPPTLSYIGRVHIYSGATIAKPGTPSPWTGGLLPNRYFLPVMGPPNAAPAQTLMPPLGGAGYQDACGFGWYLWAYNFDTTNTAPDVIVHEETRVWPGTTDTSFPAEADTASLQYAQNPSRNTGSLCFFRTIGPAPNDPRWVDAQVGTNRPTKWLFSSRPELGSRFGHNVSPIVWKDTGDVPWPAFLIGEPDHSAFNTVVGRTVPRSGRLRLFYLSKFNGMTNYMPSAQEGSWERDNSEWMNYGYPGSSFLDGPNPDECFARWTAVGDFIGGLPGRPLQFVVTAGSRDAPSAAHPISPVYQAGAAAHVGQ